MAGEPSIVYNPGESLGHVTWRTLQVHVTDTRGMKDPEVETSILEGSGGVKSELEKLPLHLVVGFASFLTLAVCSLIFVAIIYWVTRGRKRKGMRRWPARSALLARDREGAADPLCPETRENPSRDVTRPPSDPEDPPAPGTVPTHQGGAAGDERQPLVLHTALSDDNPAVRDENPRINGRRLNTILEQENLEPLESLEQPTGGTDGSNTNPSTETADLERGDERHVVMATNLNLDTTPPETPRYEIGSAEHQADLLRTPPGFDDVIIPDLSLSYLDSLLVTSPGSSDTLTGGVSVGLPSPVEPELSVSVCEPINLPHISHNALGKVDIDTIDNKPRRSKVIIEDREIPSSSGVGPAPGGSSYTPTTQKPPGVETSDVTAPGGRGEGGVSSGKEDLYRENWDLVGMAGTLFPTINDETLDREGWSNEDGDSLVTLHDVLPRLPVRLLYRPTNHHQVANVNATKVTEVSGGAASGETESKASQAEEEEDRVSGNKRKKAGRGKSVKFEGEDIEGARGVKGL